MSIEQIGFFGEVLEASCDCHKGQFFIVVFVVDPILGRQLIADKPFKTEKEANENVADFVKSVSVKFMASLGIKTEDVVKIEELHGKDAFKRETSFVNENNPNLH